MSSELYVSVITDFKPHRKALDPNVLHRKYGMKRNGQGQNEHKRETRVIYAVRQMRDEGLSFRAITICLDQMKVPTKNQGRRWHPEMVRRMI